jgi:AraC-like DNA-binding protein
MDQWAKRVAPRILCPREASADLRHSTKEDAMLSHSAVANDRAPTPPAGAAHAAFYSSRRYAHVLPRLDLTATPSPSISPEIWAAADGEEQSLFRLLLDEVESVNRLYKIVSQAGCDILFYSETGELTGRYGKRQHDGHRLPALIGGFTAARDCARSKAARTQVSPLATPIFNAEGSFVGSLDLSSAGGECTGTTAALMQTLVRSTAGAIEERAFRKRYAHEWIVALAPPDAGTCGALLAIDRNHRVVGADRRARAALLQGGGDGRASLWSLFEKNAAMFRDTHTGDTPVVLTRLGSAESWSALVTPPKPDRSRRPAHGDLHARPRIDLVGCVRSPAKVTASRGGLAPRALRRVREYIDEHVTENISLQALAEVAGLSRCHFARAFKQSVGTAPHAYLMQCRLERAERLLAETDLSLCQVALDSGFGDQSTFSRYFRRNFGVTPRSFRRARR